jgi:hypothetical protein
MISVRYDVQGRHGVRHDDMTPGRTATSQRADTCTCGPTDRVYLQARMEEAVVLIQHVKCYLHCSVEATFLWVFSGRADVAPCCPNKSPAWMHSHFFG